MQDYGVTSSTAFSPRPVRPVTDERAWKSMSKACLRQGYLDKRPGPADNPIGHLEIPAVSNNQLAAAAFAATF